MIDSKIIEKLSPITDEEKKILEKNAQIQRQIYMQENTHIIDSGKLLDTGKLITVRPHTRFVHFPEHTHNYVEVVYMCKGKTTHIVNGKKIELNEGELLFLGKGAVQEILPAKEEDIAVNFIILPQFFDRVLEFTDGEESALRNFLIDCLSNSAAGPSYLYFKVSGILPIQNLIENLLWALIYETSNRRHIFQNTMGLLFVHLMNYTELLESDNSNETTIIQVLGYIEDNYRDGSLSELCKMLHYDIYYLSREVKKRTGKTYKELLQDKRLSQAAYLLRNTNLIIEEIADMVGYSNFSYFYRIFLEKYKVTPKKYRDMEK